MFDPHCPEEVAAFEREVSNYKLVKDLQGYVVPRLLLYGELDFTGAPFLALSNEGKSLAHLDVVTEGHRDGMLEAFRKLHGAGFCHGDVRLENVCCGNDGVVKILDLEELSLVTDDMVENIDREFEAVLDLL